MTKTLIKEDNHMRIINYEELGRLQQKLPTSWLRAAGLLRHKRRELYTHLRRVRKEWSRER